MLLEKERQEIVSYGRKLLTSGLTKGTGGNLSIYNREQQLLAISPSGMDYLQITAEDVVLLNLDGTIAEGKRKPSVEWNLHTLIYENRQDINAVVHTHSLAACAVAALGKALPAINYLVALSGANAVPCAEYAAFGTSQLAENTLRTLADGYAVFLANHGLVTVGNDLERAFYIAEEMEFCCDIYLKAKAAGEPVVLSDEEMTSVRSLLTGYGQK